MQTNFTCLNLILIEDIKIGPSFLQELFCRKCSLQFYERSVFDIHMDFVEKKDKEYDQLLKNQTLILV